MQILCLGLSHQTAPIEVRERLSYPPDALQNTLTAFRHQRQDQHCNLTELVILSTCNRLEVYACVVEAEVLNTGAFAALHHFIAGSRGIPVVGVDTHLYRHSGVAVVEHLCRVAAGLDSTILGEPQILGQVAAAYKSASEHGAAGPVLCSLFRTAMRAGRRARSETGICRNSASLGSAALQFASTIIGDLREHQALVIGAGTMGTIVIRALQARGIRRIAIISRRKGRARALAEKWDAEAHSFRHFPEAIAMTDVVITCCSVPHPFINRESVEAATKLRPGRPLVFADLAVPRNISPAVREIPGAHLVNVDDLQAHVGDAVAKRCSEVPLVEAIIAEELKGLQKWQRGQQAAPVIAQLRQKAEDIRQSELERTLRRLSNLAPGPRAHVEYFSRSLVNKLLHEPTLRLRIQASNGNATEYLQTARHLFGLDVETSECSDPEAEA